MALCLENEMREGIRFAHQTKGPIILHVSDTGVGQYQLLETLLKAIRPSVLIHTGDMADEYKVGRRPQDIPAYQQYAKFLCEMLARYSRRVYYVMGNNDICDFIRRQEGVCVVSKGTILCAHGVRMKVDHVAIRSADGADYAMYGHGAKEDPHYQPHPSAPPSRYLNGNFYWTMIAPHAGMKQMSIQVRELVEI